MAATQSAVRRLQKDLQEVKANPLLNVVGEPLQDDIFEWHVNVRTCEGPASELEETTLNPLADVTFHLILVFPKNFPNAGPTVYLCTPLPHPNVEVNSQITAQLHAPGHANTQNVDLRLNYWKLSLWDCIPAYKGWSSAYSVQSVLLQLQTFLLREDLLYDVRKVASLDTAAEKARQFQCAKCGHSHKEPSPTFLTPAEIAHTLRNREKKLVSTPAGLLLQKSGIRSAVFEPKNVALTPEAVKPASVPSVQVKEAEQQQQPPPPNPSNKAEQEKQSVSITEIGTTSSSAESDSQVPEEQVAAPAPEEEWFVVGKKGKKKAQKVQPTAPAPAPLASAMSHQGKQSKLSNQAKNAPHQGKQNNASSQAKNAPPKVQVQEKAVPQKVAEPSNEPAASSGWTSVVKKQNLKQKQASHESHQQTQSVMALAKEKAAAIGASDAAAGITTSSEEAMGYFGLLPQEPLTTILCLLPKDALSSLSLTCRGLRCACEDGYVWKTLMHRNFPATSIGAASIDDWKHAYMLEQSNILGSLRCFHTKCTHEEDVLGFPISFTVNPRTKDVEYIAVHLDIISETAYKEGVRTTAENEKFTHMLPVYITEEHFERALPRIKQTAAELCPLQRRSLLDKTFHPDMVLEFMPKALNTMVVLLCDKGIQASERAIEGYCMLHRLFLALCERFKLWPKAEKAVVDFMNYPEARVKSNTPDLGRFMARLSVCQSPTTSWVTIVRPLTGEIFDRNVLWICKSNPDLVEKYKRAGRGKGVDEELLLAAWEGTKVARRLCLFHAAFLNMVARPPKVPLERVTGGYDILYGMPSAYLKKSLHTYIQKILETQYDWPFFFRIMGMQCPTKEHLTGWFGQCWKNSLEKGYHTKKTDFTNIQKSGVSKILLKGESYTAPPNVKNVKMYETWRYQESTQFLDASCLVYGFHGKQLEGGLVDWSHTTALDGAITHSGDIIDHENKMGTHVIVIDLHKLPSETHELYFTMSGWAGATLKGFRLPFVSLKDTGTDMELCQYTLDDKDLGSHRSVIMCRMFRREKGSSKWEVEAIGLLGAGSAGDYQPMHASIQDLIFKRRGPQVLNKKK